MDTGDYTMTVAHDDSLPTVGCTCHTSDICPACDEAIRSAACTCELQGTCAPCRYVIAKHKAAYLAAMGM